MTRRKCNCLTVRTGGSWHTTYSAIPHYVTSKARSVFLTNLSYAEFDFTAGVQGLGFTHFSLRPVSFFVAETTQHTNETCLRQAERWTSVGPYTRPLLSSPSAVFVAETTQLFQ